MKARVPPTTFAEVKREVAKEVEVQYKELFAQAADEILPQAVATFLWTMHVNYGWGEIRLQQLVNALKDTNNIMKNPSKLHKRFGPIDCEQYLKEKFNIDVVTEFKAEVEMK